MYIVSGSNVHGQWLVSDYILNNFQNIATKSTHRNTLFKINHAKLLVSTWSYNIFLLENTFYIAGSWLRKEHSLIEVKLPGECKPKSEANFTYTLVGNDYNLFLIDTKSLDLWKLNFEDSVEWNWSHVKINLNVELPLNNDENITKKQKLDTYIKKVVSTNITLCILTSDGDIYEIPNKVNIRDCIGTVIDVDYGYEFGILLTDAGRVYTWGNGRRCQLGHGDLNNLEEPAEVEALAGIKIVKIKAGGWHSLALSEFGDLYAWGWNDAGQLGILNEAPDDKRSNSEKVQPSISCSVPTLVDLFDENGTALDVTIKDIACGSRHSAILLEDNTVWTTGMNKYGQLGYNPKEVPSLSYFKNLYDCKVDGDLFGGPWCTGLKTRDSLKQILTII